MVCAWHNRRTLSQDAQKARLLTRPTLARRDAPCPKQGRSSAVDPRFTFHASRFTAAGSAARTKLAGFFSILLGLLDWFFDKRLVGLCIEDHQGLTFRKITRNRKFVGVGRFGSLDHH